MKLEHSCNYFIKSILISFLSIVGRILSTAIFLNLLIYCGSDRKKQNEIKRNECFRLSYLAFTNLTHSQTFSESESQKLTYSLSYSCSADSGQSPSCIEYFAKNAEDKALNSVCIQGYRKTSSLCSQQNAIGSCIIFKDYGYEKINYSRPNDDLNQSELDCRVRNGNFKSQENNNLLATLLLNCELIQVE